METRTYQNSMDVLKDLDIDEELKQQIAANYRATRVSSHLSALRCKNGLSQTQLAKQAGCSRKTIDRIENAYDKDLKLSDIIQYVKALDIKFAISFLEHKPTIIEAFRYHLNGMQNCRDEIIKLAGEDYTILEGAQKHLCEQADELLEAFKQFEEKMKKVTTGIEENEEETEPFIVETSQETELCNQD